MAPLMHPLPLYLNGWKVIEDLGMVEISSLNSRNGNPQRKRFVKIQCPKCGGIVQRQLGNIKSRVVIRQGNLRCLNCSMPGRILGKAHPISTAYRAMIKRCYNPTAKSYPGHGGKGIKVCEAWLKYPRRFADWAFSHGWKEGLFLDREDNDGDYTPENCRWVTPKISAMNRGFFKNNTSGYKNISPYKNPRSSKHRFQVMVQGHRVGYFDTLEQAIEARDKYYKILICPEPKKY